MRADPLSAMRDRFLLPDGPDGPDGPPAIYLAGQSLGLQPRSARDAVEEVLDRWARLGVDGWFTAERPWFTEDDALREPMARIVGARPAEIAILNSLTVNLHALLTSFFRPAGRRRRILVDAPLFPSDRHALTSHLASRGLDPSADLVVVAPRAGEATLRPDDLAAAIGDHGPDLTLVVLAGVNFATGQVLDIERFTAVGHAAGVPVLWDLAQPPATSSWRSTIGTSTPPSWCTYKYLNGGPGSIGAIFVHERFHARRHAAAPGRLVGERPRSAVRDGRALRPGRRRRRLEGVDRVRAGDGAAGRLIGDLRRGRDAGVARPVDRLDRLPCRPARRAGRRGHHPARSGRQGRPAVAAVRVRDARRGRARRPRRPRASCPTSGRPISSASRRCRCTRPTTMPGQPAERLREALG